MRGADAKCYPFRPSGVLYENMMSALTLTSSTVSRWRLFSLILAIVGQLGIFGASLTLAREETSAVSHTEQSGINLHHGHNEATCVACTALSFHATLAAATPDAIGHPASFVNARRLVCLPAELQLLPNSCRAPPREA